MHLWTLSHPELASNLRASRRAHNEAIARACYLSAHMVVQIAAATARGLVVGTSVLWRAIRQRNQRRRAIAALRQLDDCMLRDIGVARADIVGVVEGTLHHRSANWTEPHELPRPSETDAAPQAHDESLPRAA